jgi:hypothetical protein
MSTYYSKQVHLLLILCSAKAETSCDSHGMKTLFDEISDKFTDNKAGSSTFKYLQNLLANAKSGGNISLSPERANVLSHYAGFRSYDEFASCYRDLSSWEGLLSGSFNIIGDQKTLSELKECTETLVNCLPASPDFQPYNVCPDPKDLKAPVLIAVNTETVTTFFSGGEAGEIVRSGHLIYWHEYEPGDEFEVNIPTGSQTITYQAKLAILICLACHPGLLPDAETVPQTKTGFQGTVNGTVFQGGVNISQHNHSTGQQFVTSSDVHITNNHHLNK